MKKQLLLKPLLTLALVLVCGNVWGKDVTYSMTIDSSNTGDNNVHLTATSTESLSYGGIDWSVSIVGTTSITGSKSYCQIGSKTNPATSVVFKTKGFAGKKIVSASLTGYCMSNEGPALTISAGGTSMLNNQALVKTTSTTYTSTNNNVTLAADGEIVFSISSSAKAAIVVSQITVVYDDGTASIPVERVEISKETTSIVEGDKETLTAFVYPDDASNKAVEWYSSDESIARVTNGVVSAVSPGTAIITVETLDGGKKATCEVTVTKYNAVAGTYTISLNNELFGIGTGNNPVEQSAKKFGVSITTGCISNASTKTNYQAAHVRFYADSYLKIVAPDDFIITEVVFVADGTWNDYGIEAKSGDYTATEKKWIGVSPEVDFSFVQQCRIASMSVTYIAVESAAFAATISAAKYATICLPFDFTVPTGVTAYTGAATNDGVTLTAIDGVVPAKTGVILYSETAGTYTFTGSAETPATLGTNNLVGVTEATAVPEGSYILALDTDNTAKFFEIDPTDNTLAANKAYLTIPSGVTPSKALAIRRGDATGIENIKKTEQAVYIDLMGRKVANPTPGIYILDGKKVLVK